MRRTIALIAVCLLGFLSSVVADEEIESIDGVFGLTSYDLGSWLAVRVEVPEGFALNGLRWFHNDSEAVFASIRVGTGFLESPGPVDDFIEVATDVQGQSSSWSYTILNFPVIASMEALYVVFELPHELPLVQRGTGGGAAIGYSSDGHGLPGWLGGDGATWAMLHPDYGFALEPVLVQATDDMQVKSLDEKEIAVLREPFLSAGPNPFNPKTDISYGIAKSSHVRLVIYDVRGRRVCCLVDDYQEQGKHSVSWLGRDSSGRNVASGVYIMRLESGDLELTQRLMLVR